MPESMQGHIALATFSARLKIFSGVRVPRSFSS